MPFELLLYLNLTFCLFFGFAVGFSSQNGSFFLCMYSELRHCKKQPQIYTGFIYNYCQFTPAAEEASRSCWLLFLTNKRSFFSAFLWGHPAIMRLQGPQFLYFITDGAKRTICQAAMNTGSGTDKSLCSKWVVWKKKRLPAFEISCAQPWL